MKIPLKPTLVTTALLALATVVRADEVTDWNLIMLTTLRLAGVVGAPATRPAATVQAAVYDAVNGIEKRYTAIHVQPAAAPGASRRAAAVQAAYSSLVQLFPAQKANLDPLYAASMADIASSEAVANSESIARGIEWGQAVATAMVAWRNADGFTPAPAPYFGGTAVGQWRPTLPSLAPFAYQLGFTTPWVITSPLQFSLPGPPSVTSAQYTADFNEVKAVGSLTSTTRTADQTSIARFWASASSPNYFCNRVAVALGEERNTTLSENARILALLNIAIADAAIVTWRQKRIHEFWRPITAIQLALTDGNPATAPDPTWMPLLATPPYPDYPSGLVGLSAAGMAVLADYFGEDAAFTLDSDSPAFAGVHRSFTSFAQAIAEAVDARIYSGIHFRFADVDAARLGAAVAEYILASACQPLHGAKTGQLRK